MTALDILVQALPEPGHGHSAHAETPGASFCLEGKEEVMWLFLAFMVHREAL